MKAPWGPLISLGPATILLALLLFQISADPATGVTFSNSPFTDEAWNVMAARNMVLLGDWSAGNWPLHLVQLPFTLLETATFWLLGVGIVQARLAAVLCTMAAVALITIVARRRLGAIAGLVAGSGLAGSSLLLYYGRLAYIENLVMLALVAAAAVLCWRPALVSRAGAGAAGSLLAVAIGSKPSAAFAAMGLLLGVAIAIHRRDWTARVLAAGAVVAVAGIGWLLLIGLPDARQVTWVLQILAEQRAPRDLGELLGRVVGYPSGSDGAFLASLPLLIGGAGGLVVVVARWRSFDEGRRALAGAVVGWLLAGIGLLLVVSYRPSRYALPLLPPLAVLCGYLVMALVEWLRDSRVRWVGAVVVAAALAGLVIPGAVRYGDWAGHATSAGPGIQARAVAAMDGRPVEGGLAAFIAMRVPAPIYVRWSTSDMNTGDLYAEDGVRWVVITGAYRPTWADAHLAAWDARTEHFCVEWGRGTHCLVSLP